MLATKVNYRIKSTTYRRNHVPITSIGSEPLPITAPGRIREKWTEDCTVDRQENYHNVRWNKKAHSCDNFPSTILPITVVTQGCRSLLRYLISSMNSALSFFQFGPSCLAAESRFTVLNIPTADALPLTTLDLAVPAELETKLEVLVPDIRPILPEFLVPDTIPALDDRPPPDDSSSTVLTLDPLLDFGGITRFTATCVPVERI